MKNYELLKSIAYTRYSDWKGVISIDNENYLGVQDLCKEKGVDIDKHFIIGFGVDDGEGIGNPSISVLLADKTEFGDSMQEIIDKAMTGEPVKVIKKTFGISYKELAKAIKRLSFMALWKEAQNLEIVKA